MSFKYSFANWAWQTYIKQPESIPLYERISNDDGQHMYRSLAKPEKPPVTEISAVRDIAQAERSSVSDVWKTRNRFFTDPPPPSTPELEQKQQPEQQQEQEQQRLTDPYPRNRQALPEPEAQKQVGQEERHRQEEEVAQPTKNESTKNHTRAGGGTARTNARLNDAIDAAIQHNNSPDRPQDEKWSITINSLKAFSSSAPAIRSILEQRKDEIDSHHNSHELDPAKHNYVHRGKQRLSDVIQLDSKPEVQKPEVGQEEQQHQQQQGDHTAYAYASKEDGSGGSGHFGRLRPGDGTVIRSWEPTHTRKSMEYER